MSWRSILSKLRRLPSHTNVATGLDEEIRTHLEFEMQENIERGLPEAQARRAALLRFGNPELARERAHEAWGFPTFESCLSDLRFGLRVLRRSPGFTVTSIATLALGIGVTTAIFSVAYSILLRPLPYPNPQQLVLLHQFNKANDTGNWRATALDFLDWRERARSFEGIAAFTGTGLVFTGDRPAEMVLGQRVSYNLFSVLRVSPMLGRDFRPEEEEKGRDRVVILSYGLWHRMFAGDARVLGRAVTINGEAFTVIGVMPNGFQFPSKQYAAWLPQAFRGNVDDKWVNRSAHFLRTVGRLKPGVSIAQADREMKTIATALEREFPGTDVNEGARIESLTESIVGNSRTSLRLLVAASVCLLLIACANIANLLLARSIVREREFALRKALGAVNRRIVRQLLTENAGLVFAGGLVGCALAYLLVFLAVKLGPTNLPRLEEARVDTPVLIFACLAALSTGALFSLLPFVSMRKEASTDALNIAGKGTTAPNRVQRLRAALVSGEIAICVVLLFVAGLTSMSLLQLGAVDPGFNPQNAVSFSVVMMEQPFPDAPKMRRFMHGLLNELAQIPSVRNVGITTSIPLSGNPWSNPVSIEGGTDSPLTGVRPVSAGYLSAMQTPVIRGRGFTDTDDEHAPHIALLTVTAARQLFGDRDPLGKHVRLGDADSTDPWRTVVGIVADVRDSALEMPPEPLLFVPYDQLGDALTPAVGRGIYVVMRTDADPAATIGFARARLHQINPSVPMHDVETLREMVSASVAQPRFRSFLFASFAIISLLLAAVGLYGLLSYTIAQRTREFGIRIALGATRMHVLKLVLVQGGRLVLIGAFAAAIVCAGVLPLVRSLLYAVSPADPSVIVGVASLLTFVAGVAVLIPAHNASQSDPITAIRYE